MPRTRIGLEIGTRNIKAVEISGREGNYKLEKIATVEIPPLEEKSVERERVTVGAIRNLIRNHKLNSKNVISCVGGEGVIVRRIRMPMMGEKEVGQAIRWEAEEYLPFPIDQVNLGFQILERNLRGEAGAEEMAVLIVGAKKELIQKHLRILEFSNVFPQVIDVSALALFNAYQVSYPGELTGVALIELGHTTSSIVILHNGLPLLVRNIDLGGYQITTALATEFNTNFINAERLKKDYGIMGGGEIPEGKERETAERVDKVIRGAMDDLVGEIVRSFEYYASQAERTSVEKVMLSGGTARIQNMDSFLSEELGVPVEVINPFRNIHCEPKTFQPTYLAEVGPLFTVSVGLALRELPQL